MLLVLLELYYLLALRLQIENCIGLENECVVRDGTSAREQCAVTSWSDWSPCSVTCGQGMRERRKFYLNKLDMNRCNKRTEQQELCVGDTADCAIANANKNFTGEQ